MGAAAGVEFPGRTQTFRVSVAGKNLTNQRYRDYSSLLRHFADEPGWSVSLRLSVAFDRALGARAGS